MTEDDRIRRLLRAASLTGAEPGPALAGGTSAGVRRIDRAGRPIAAAKLARPGLPVRRVDAEAWVLGVIGPRAGLTVPALLARVEEDLLIGWAGPADGPARRPAATDVLTTLARVHAAPLEAADRRWLAPWGRGTAGRPAPFARRARRVARRAEGFLELLPSERRGAWRPRLAAVSARFEPACTRVRSLPAGLLHGDLHPGHALATGAGVTLVDWQHASVGPAVVDVVRVLTEHGPGTPEETDEAAARALDAAGRAAIDDALVLTIGGLVAGFGARTPGDLAPWERAIVERATDPDGWAARRLDHAGASGGG